MGEGDAFVAAVAAAVVAAVVAAVSWQPVELVVPCGERVVGGG